MAHRSIAKRSIEPSLHHQRRLNDDNRVAWSQQQRAKSRQKRDFLRVKPTRSISKLLNDPKWSTMWYLNVSIVIDIFMAHSGAIFIFFIAFFALIVVWLVHIHSVI